MELNRVTLTLFSGTSLKETNTQHSGHADQNFQTEFMVEIYSKSLVRAIGEVVLMKLIKTHKGDGKGPLLVNKLFWWPTPITLDNNNDVLTDL